MFPVRTGLPFVEDSVVYPKKIRSEGSMCPKLLMVEHMEKDYMSNLPEHIIHEILDRITMLYVARTSCVSKPWKSFSVSSPYLNINQQDFNHVPCDQFKNIMQKKVRSMSIQEEGLVIFKFKLCMNFTYVREAIEEIQRCVTLLSKTSTLKEFDFHIINGDFRDNIDSTFFHQIYDVETLTMLRLSGLTVRVSSKDIKLSNLQILILDKVMSRSESAMNWFFTSFSLIKELRLVKCYGLEHLKVSGLCHLERLEIGFCEMLVSVEIQAPSLEKLVLTEIKRNRYDEFHLALSIDSQTCETLRELTLCNSSLRGITFSQMFSGCSNVESLVLDRCKNFYGISISSQKLRKLLLIRCFNLIKTNIKAPNLTSFNFSHYLHLEYWYYDDSDAAFSTLPGLRQYSDEISHLQESTLDFHQMLGTKNTWISLWFYKFKCSVGQKMVIYPKNGWHDVIVLEDWSSMAQLPLMTKISEVARRTIITTMSFNDLADYLFGDSKNIYNVLAISCTDRSKFYKVLEKKPKISCIQRSSMVVAKTHMDALLPTTCWPSYFHANGFFYQALLEAGMAATLKATQLLLKPKY